MKAEDIGWDGVSTDNLINIQQVSSEREWDDTNFIIIMI